MSNFMDIDYDKLEKKIKKAKSKKELDKLYTNYRDNLGLSDGNPEIERLFKKQGKVVYRTTRDSPSPSPSPSPIEFFQDTPNASNKFIYNFPGIPVNKTKDNRFGCEKATDCMIRSAHGMNMLSQEDRDALVKMIDDTGITIPSINKFLKSNKRNMRLIEVPISGIDIHSWAMEKMRNDSCSMVMLKLKPNDDPNIKYVFHAVIICKEKNVITLWDTQRNQDYPELVRNESKDAIEDYLKKTNLLGTDFSLITGKKEIELDKLFEGLKLKNKKSSPKRARSKKRKTPLRTQDRRKKTLRRQRSAREKKLTKKRNKKE